MQHRQIITCSNGYILQTRFWHLQVLICMLVKRCRKINRTISPFTETQIFVKSWMNSPLKLVNYPWLQRSCKSAQLHLKSGGIVDKVCKFKSIKIQSDKHWNIACLILRYKQDDNLIKRGRNIWPQDSLYLTLRHRILELVMLNTWSSNVDNLHWKYSTSDHFEMQDCSFILRCRIHHPKM